jgi:hypothetical protein
MSIPQNLLLSNDPVAFKASTIALKICSGLAVDYLFLILLIEKALNVTLRPAEAAIDSVSEPINSSLLESTRLLKGEYCSE